MCVGSLEERVIFPHFAAVYLPHVYLPCQAVQVSKMNGAFVYCGLMMIIAAAKYGHQVNAERRTLEEFPSLSLFL